MESQNLDIAIIGGGISGLTCGYEIQKAAPHLRVKIFESSNRLGGNLKTLRHRDCLIDVGADSFINAKPWALEFAHELQLEDEIIHPNPKKNSVFYIRNQQPFSMPAKSYLGVPSRIIPWLQNPSLPLNEKLMIFKDLSYFFRIRRNRFGDESIYDFFSRHFGSDLTQHYFEPILAGIYAGSSKDLSIHSTFPQFVQLEKKYGSLTLAAKQMLKARKNKPIFTSFKNGIEQLITSIKNRIPMEWIELDSKINRITFDASKKTFNLYENQDALFQSQAIISTIPSQNAKELLFELPPLSDLLEPFETQSTATIFFCFSREDVPSELLERFNGLGFIIPKSEGSPIMAGTLISNKYPNRCPEDQFLMRVFWNDCPENPTPNDETAMCNQALEKLQLFFPIKAKPKWSKVFHWYKKSPQYQIGHERKVKAIEEACKEYSGLRIIGNHFYGVGIPDSVRKD